MSDLVAGQNARITGPLALDRALGGVHLIPTETVFVLHVEQGTAYVYGYESEELQHIEAESLTTINVIDVVLPGTEGDIVLRITGHADASEAAWALGIAGTDSVQAGLLEMAASA
jgi:hypothetical protein